MFTDYIQWWDAHAWLAALIVVFACVAAIVRANLD